MIYSIVPVGDGVMLLLPDHEASAIKGGNVCCVEAAEIGISVGFDVAGSRYSVEIPYETGVYLSETDGNVYIYGLPMDSIIAKYACLVKMEKGPLYKALGAWDALYAAKVAS